MLRVVAKRDELWSGEMIGLEVAGTRLLLVCIEDEVHAYEDRCLHRGLPLSRGRLCGSAVTCPAHEWQYDLARGEGINPRGIRLRRFAVELRGDEILVDLDSNVGGESR